MFLVRKKLMTYQRTEARPPGSFPGTLPAELQSKAATPCSPYPAAFHERKKILHPPVQECGRDALINAFKTLQSRLALSQESSSSQRKGLQTGKRVFFPDRSPGWGLAAEAAEMAHLNLNFSSSCMPCWRWLWDSPCQLSGQLTASEDAAE